MFEPERMRQQTEKPKTNWTIKFAVPIRDITEKKLFSQSLKIPRDIINQNMAIYKLKQNDHNNLHGDNTEAENFHNNSFKHTEENKKKIRELEKRMQLYRMSIAKKEIEDAEKKHGFHLTDEQKNRFIRIAGANPFSLTEEGNGLTKELKKQEDKLVEVLKDDGKAPGSLKPDELMEKKAKTLQNETKGVNIPKFGYIRLTEMLQDNRREALKEHIRLQPKTLQTVRQQMKKWRQRHTMLTTAALRQLGRV